MRTGLFPYRTLKLAIQDKATPLRLHLDETYPHIGGLQKRFRVEAGPMLVEGGDANAGTVGSAFDWLTRFVLDPINEPEVAFHGVQDYPALSIAVAEMVASARDPMARASVSGEVNRPGVSGHF